MTPALRGDGLFWEIMVWLHFPIRTCSVFLALEAPLRLLDFDEVDARPSSEGLDRLRCSKSNLALFLGHPDREFLRACCTSFLSLMRSSKASRTFVLKIFRNPHLMFNIPNLEPVLARHLGGAITSARHLGTPCAEEGGLKNGLGFTEISPDRAPSRLCSSRCGLRLPSSSVIFWPMWAK